MNEKKYYVTSPIYYVNGSPHIGHAYTQVVCDTITRYYRQRSRQIFFLTGTDEHGKKIEKTAIEAGFGEGKEKAFVDSIIPRFTSLWKKLNIEYDHFIRTTESYHKKTVQDILQKIYDKGDIYAEIYKGFYCTPCEMFWSLTQSKDGKCPDCGRKVEPLNEKNYFFKMSKYKHELIEKIEKDEIKVEPNMRKNEVLGFLKGNELHDLCISRPKTRLKWGIELPFDKDFVSYVWFDALTNYFSGLNHKKGKDFDHYWNNVMHVVGKDIIRHHAIYWPIMLMAIDVKPPQKIFAHGWWMVGKEKMSKSKGNVLDPIYLLDEKKYPVDAIRYFLLSQVEFGSDGSFSEELFIEKYNSDLANDLGNLLNRSLNMVEKYFKAKVPPNDGSSDCLNKEAVAFHAELMDSYRLVCQQVDSFVQIDGNKIDFQAALSMLWGPVQKANKYIEVCAPWTCAKEGNTKALELIMGTLMQVLGKTAVLLYPFMPETSQKMWKQLGMSSNVCKINSEKLSEIVIPVGTKIKKGDPLFPRLDKIG